MEEEATELIEKFHNRMGKIVDEKYRDWVANDLAKFHCDLMIEDAQFDIYNGVQRIKYWNQLKELIKQM